MFCFQLNSDASPRTQKKVLHCFPLSPILPNFKMYVTISWNQHERRLLSAGQSPEYTHTETRVGLFS